jgi:hypothetical protein
VEKPEDLRAANAAWNIERLDQELNYGGRVVGTTLRHSEATATAVVDDRRSAGWVSPWPVG